MSTVAMTVNGRAVEADVPPRLHLADFVRERLLLTGTHLGCEHGVCGACTLLIDGEPARSCLAYAAACGGAAVTTIEGLGEDPVMARLRAAFTTHHALQCGYCTPGMLVTARDIVLRLPEAHDDDIRLELAGNLCRCTGYNGIVRAIRQVLDELLDEQSADPLPNAPERAQVAAVSFGAVALDRTPIAPTATPGGGLHPRLRFDVPPAALWAELRDPASIVGCIPGATLLSVAPDPDQHHDQVEGEMVVALGPVRARFRGQARLVYDDEARTGHIAGGGQDQASGTRLDAAASFGVHPDGQGSMLAVDIEYALKGPLAQLAKGRVVDLVADEIADLFARGLRARLAGEAAPVARPLSAMTLAWRVVRAWFRGLRA